MAGETHIDAPPVPGAEIVDSTRGPRLARYLGYITMLDMPDWSSAPTGDLDAIAAGVRSAGYQGVQVYLPDQITAFRDAGLDVCVVGRVTKPESIDEWVRWWEDLGPSSITAHLGTGFEDRSQGFRLVEALVSAASSASVEVLVETHRATVVQDPARTLEFVDAFPELRFTADLSHWYTGSEMTYGGFDWKLELIRPVLERTRMIHGRISDPGCVQVTVSAGDQASYVAHFRQMWSVIFQSFLESGTTTLPFAAELLPASAHYARTAPGATSCDCRREESDRWSQAALLWSIAEEVFAAALKASTNPADGRAND